MNILALETSGEYLSIALRYRNDCLSRQWLAQQKHAEMALPEIRRLLIDIGGSLSEIDGIAFSNGPGSFTSLRIGCGLVQGLALGLDIPVVGVDTLLALAETTIIEDNSATKVLTVLDARMGEVYLAAFERKQHDEWCHIISTTLCNPSQLKKLPNNQTTMDWIGAGNGFIAHKYAMTNCYSRQLKNVHADYFPHAKGVLNIAETMFAQNKAVAPEHLQLHYIRNNVAHKTQERNK